MSAKLRKIVTYPHPLLSERSVEVADEDIRSDHTQQLIDDMILTMDAANGVGLSAVQVGELLRIVVVNVNGDTPLVLINPRIIDTQGEMVFEEGCLSVPGVFEERTRANNITVEYADRLGEYRTLQTEGLESYCLQHEIDHLDGALFVDNLSALKKQRARKQIKKTIRALTKIPQTRYVYT